MGPMMYLFSMIFGAEFAGARQGVFDRVMDGLNRLPRQAMALGTLALFVSAMVDPVWFWNGCKGLRRCPRLWRISKTFGASMPKPQALLIPGPKRR